MSTWLYVAFTGTVLALLALDLGVFHRRPHADSVRVSLLWSSLWIALGLSFTGAVHAIYANHWMGAGIEPPLDATRASIQYLAGYLVEKSLSLDNVFVIALIFSYFGIPREYQHRTLFWGVLGALVLRGIMIYAGVALLERFEWVTYIFGALLLFTAVRIARGGHEKVDPERNPLVRIARRLCRVSPGLEGQRFLTTVDGKRAITPLFLVLLVIESMDVVFAVDSIPAVFAVTREPFIVYTSNVFAILGLRQLYFALAGALEALHHLKHSLVVVLAFVGVKMLLSEVVHVPAIVSLAVIVVVLGAGAIVSVVRRPRKEPVPFSRT